MRKREGLGDPKRDLASKRGMCERRLSHCEVWMSLAWVTACAESFYKEFDRKRGSGYRWNGLGWGLVFLLRRGA